MDESMMLPQCAHKCAGDSAAVYDIVNEDIVLIWAFGQVYTKCNHKFLSDVEFTAEQFFLVDELK